jgi:hypothetical protein
MHPLKSSFVLYIKSGIILVRERAGSPKVGKAATT